MLQRLLRRLVRTNRPTMMAEASREKALDKLREHGIAAHFYFPAVGRADQDLENALRLLGGCGYITTDRNGSVVGKVAKARLTTDERAQESRKRFFLVEH